MLLLRSTVAVTLVCTLALAPHALRAQGATEAMSKPGAHLVLALDMAEVRASWLGALREEMRNRLRDASIGHGRPTLTNGAVEVRLARPEDADRALKALADLAPAAPGGAVERLLALVRGAGSDVALNKTADGSITLTPTEAGLARRTSAALDDAVAIAGRRLEGMGIAASAARRGNDQIYVHAPDARDTAALKEFLTRSARLAFHEVHPTMSAEQARRGSVPAGYRIYPAPPDELLVRATPLMRGSDLVEAQAALDQRTHEPVITFRFSAAGARTFARVTRESVGRAIAIVLDDVVLSAPVIREPILGGSGQVSGNFTAAEAQQLAVLLRAGSLPATLSVVEERMVPASR
jgi:preprotein translocase subunit SecD